MNRSLKKQYLTYLISAALIMSVIFSFHVTNNGSASPIFPLMQSKQAPAVTYYHASLPNVQSFKAAAPLPLIRHTSAVTLPAQVKPSAASTNPSKEELVLHKEPVLHTYEVTSYYLNVRSEPNSKSDIIKVVKQGTELSVLTATTSGWLQLKDGGYVHGDYAAPIGVKTKLSVTTLSAAPNRAKQSVPLSPRKLIVKTTIGKPASPTAAVNSDSGLTAEHIARILKGTKLAGQGLEEAILDIEEKYGINAFFTIAVMKLESGNGKSRLSQTKNNLFGLNATTGSENKKAFSFATKGDSVRKFGQLISKNYVGKGLTTIEKVAKKYCPANGRWSGHVKSIMKSDFRKLA